MDMEKAWPLGAEAQPHPHEIPENLSGHAAHIGRTRMIPRQTADSLTAEQKKAQTAAHKTRGNMPTRKLLWQACPSPLFTMPYPSFFSWRSKKSMASFCRAQSWASPLKLSV